MHTLFGLQQRGANLIDGVHAWNAGGTPTTGDNPMPWVRSDLGAGISITSDGAQSRLVNNYLDGSLLIIADPTEIVVTDTFFINAYTVLVSGMPLIRNFEMRQNTYVCPGAVGPACLSTRTVHHRQSEGDPAAPKLRPNFTQALTSGLSITDELVMPSNTTDMAAGDVGTVTTTTARLSLTMSKEFTFELGSRLLFGWIDTVSYEVTIDMPPPAAFTPHRARTPVGTTVTVDFAEPVNATVTLTATQGIGESVLKVKTDDRLVGLSRRVTPRVWPIPAELRTTRGGAPSVLSAALKIVASETPTDSVVANAISRYALIMRNLTASATETGAGVTRVDVHVEPASDAANLTLQTNYSYTLALADGDSTVRLSAASRYAVAHGLETLAQLYSSSNRGFSGFRVVDSPAFPYRALMVDCGRRFVPLPTLYEIIDGMAYSKMSVLNLHASEYGLFRIEIKAFPELTSGLGSAFYSQTDIQQLVEFARLRGIRVVPQIGKRNRKTLLYACNGSGAELTQTWAQTCQVTRQGCCRSKPAGSLNFAGRHHRQARPLFSFSTTRRERRSLS